jgi:ectoine hydroxylase-related dioxygenase (phytanoyl-CoA dioxygenase family)
VDRFGGKWATSHFRMGDVVLLNMYLLHGSLTNCTNKFRISCDTRYQPAGEPVDERWIGEVPKGHTEFWQPGVKLEPVEVSRRRWGV